jgi:hypothetical protein
MKRGILARDTLIDEFIELCEDMLELADEECKADAPGTEPDWAQQVRLVKTIVQKAEGLK